MCGIDGTPLTAPECNIGFIPPHPLFLFPIAYSTINVPQNSKNSIILARMITSIKIKKKIIGCHVHQNTFRNKSMKEGLFHYSK